MAQKRNPQNEELLSAHMARRDEPNFALGNAISTYLALPALRGFWPTSAHHVTTQAWYVDDIACGYDMNAYGSPHLGFSNLYPWAYLDGNENFYYLDNAQFDIRGIDPPTAVANQGLTLGMWIRFDALNTGTDQYFFCKWLTTTTDRSYALYENGAGALKFKISSDGTGVAGSVDVITSAATPVIDTWYFVVGRWDTINTDIFVDGVKTHSVSSEASIFNSTANLLIGRDDAGTDWFTGYFSMAFICAASVSDSILKNIWHQTRYLFNK